MVVGSLVWHKRYSLVQYGSVVLVVVGLATVRGLFPQTAPTHHSRPAILRTRKDWASTLSPFPPTQPFTHHSPPPPLIPLFHPAPLGQFVLADAAAEPNFQPVGVLIICGALLADAFVGNTQESLFAYVAEGMDVADHLPSSPLPYSSG